MCVARTQRGEPLRPDRPQSNNLRRKNPKRRSDTQGFECIDSFDAKLA